MKKYSLFFAVLLLAFSADGFARTENVTSGTNPLGGNDSNLAAKPAVKNDNIILSFKGSIANNTSKLYWITEDEKGMKSYTIERSTNNRDFYPIAVMPAMNENGQLFYKYPDPEISKLSSQVFSYRLKITDANNKEKYSQVIILYPDNKSGAVAIR